MIFRVHMYNIRRRRRGGSQWLDEHRKLLYGSQVLRRVKQAHGRASLRRASELWKEGCDVRLSV